MAIQTSCPGCGGPIYVEDRAGMAVCQFCGTRFKVNLDEAAPRLQKDERPVVEPEPEPVVEQQPVQEEWHPPQPEPPDAPYTPPPAFEPKPAPTSPVNRLFKGRLWLVIALVIGAVLCATCTCLALVAQNISGRISF